MSEENMHAFQRGLDAMRRGEVEEFLRDAAEDVVWLAARSAVEGAYRGHEGVREFFADNEENFEVFEPDFHDVRDLGDRILAIGTIHIRGRGSGVETDIPAAGIATFEHGKLIKWEDFRERRVALAAAGLPE